MDVIEVVGFDGDDTLWHSEHLFADAHERVATLLAPHVERGVLERRMHEVERANLALFGYGIKGFTLSLIETAIELTEGAVTASEIGELLTLGKTMLAHPVDLLDGVTDVLAEVAMTRRLVLITKGDLLHQESKIARSGLAERFEQIEIVVDKDEQTYRRIIAATGTPPERFAMVGNSLRSDVLPVVAAGGHGVLIPYEFVAEHEKVDDADPARDGYRELESISGLPAALDALDELG
jgi:putative hydrolase of the HAD superfamily